MWSAFSRIAAGNDIAKPVLALLVMLSLLAFQALGQIASHSDLDEHAATQHGEHQSLSADIGTCDASLRGIEADCAQPLASDSDDQTNHSPGFDHCGPGLCLSALLPTGELKLELLHLKQLARMSSESIRVSGALGAPYRPPRQHA